ncbi:MAG: TetR/AcrR family transcriptional regulator [Desulfobacterales bacterium]|nr:TetR/AcrR family transcriptional regulator [Desulfobacterales bacterium]
MPKHPADIDIRERIIEETIQLFATKGYDGTSLQLIADAIGIKKSSLLYHVSSKEELRDQVYKNLLSHWKNELPQLLSTASGEHDRFSSVINAFVSYFLENSNRSKVAIREMLDRPDEVRKAVKEHLGSWIKLITDYIVLGKKLGVVKPDIDPDSYIIQVIMMVIGTVALGSVISAMFDNKDSRNINPLIGELERIARHALLVNPTPKPQKTGGKSS